MVLWNRNSAPPVSRSFRYSTSALRILAAMRVVYALIPAPRGHLRAVRVTEQDPHPHPRARLVREDLLYLGVLGQEQPGVDEHTDLALRGLEQPSPGVPGHIGAVRVDGQHLTLRGRRHLVTGQRVRPEVGLIPAQARSHRVAVLAVGLASGDPAFDRLLVDAEFIAQRGRRETALQ